MRVHIVHKDIQGTSPELVRLAYNSFTAVVDADICHECMHTIRMFEREGAARVLKLLHPTCDNQDMRPELQEFFHASQPETLSSEQQAESR